MYSNLKKAQNRLLEMGIEISKILDKHNIPYMLAYGTLLGAVRHKGFIPWDDDFDFFLFDDSYDSAIEFLRNELSSEFFLEDSKSEPLYFHAWAHIKDKYTEAYSVLFPQDNSYKHHGLSIDLYRIKLMQENKAYEYLIEENRKYLNNRLKNGLISKSEYDVRLEKAKVINSNIDNNSNKLAYILLNPYYCKKIYVDDIFPLKSLEFENFCFKVPNNYEKILSDIYGEFMNLPPEDKRHSHYDEVVFLK